MGRYSRKDMIEFAKYAKSYQSSNNVEQAYADYLGGKRLVTPKRNPEWYWALLGAHEAYVDGKLVKSRFPTTEPVTEFEPQPNLRVESWDKDKRVLHLTTT